MLEAMDGPAQLEVHVEPTGSGGTCRSVLDALPHWFGFPESVDDYVAAAEANPTVVASLADRSVGILTLVTHTPYAAEVSVDRKSVV